MAKIITCGEAIQEIVKCLEQCDGDYITEIYNYIINKKAIYKEDSLIEVEDKCE